jgi:hypothetical protein
MKNIIQSQFTATDVTEVDDTITTLKDKLKGKTGILNAEERTRYGSVNEQNKLVVNKAREFRQNSPDLSAPGVDWVEFEKDYQARIFLESWINSLQAMLDSLKSTKIMHDYDNYQDALKDYGYSQYQHGAGEDGYSAKVEEFKQFFTKSTKNTTPEGGEGEGTNS